MKRKVVLAALLLMPVFFLLPHLNDFFLQPGSQYTDIAVSHYPNGVFLQDTISKWKTIPFWSPMILSGYPFVANPLSGLHYLPGWLAFLFPLPFGFNLTIIIHLVLAGVGAFLFLKAEGLRDSTAIFGAMIFEASPKIYSHLGAGHLTLIYAVSLTPWLLYIEKRWGAARFRWVAPGVLIGMIALADVRWAAYSGLLWAVYSAAARIRAFHSRASSLKSMFLTLAGSLFSNGVMAFLIASPLLLPLAQFVSLSTRGSLSSNENMILSLPPAQLLGLAIPNIGGSAEWVLYPGGVAFFLLIYTIFSPVLRKQTGFWLGVIFLTIFISLGSYIPYLDLLFQLPVLNLLRVPPRVIFITELAFAVLSAMALDYLLGLRTDANVGRDKAAELAIFGLVTFTILMAMAAWLVVKNGLAVIQFGWAAAVMLAGFVILRFVFWQRKNDRWFFVLFVSLAMADLISINALSLVSKTPQQMLSEGQEIVRYLQEGAGGGQFRVYSSSYSLPQQTAARFGIELADGVDPLQLNSYVAFMERATGVPSDGYSVTLPPYKNGNPAEDNRFYTLDPKLLGLVNVRYVVSGYSLSNDQLALMRDFGNTKLYQNQQEYPRAWVQPAETVVGENIRPAQVVEYQPNIIRIRARGPGLLVLSELFYPGWRVIIDNSPATSVIVIGLLRGVQLPEGEHFVVFSYFPGLFIVGLLLNGLACLVVAIMVFYWRRSSGRKS